MAVEADVVEHLSDRLACGDVVSVRSIIAEEKFEQILKERSSDIIPIASYHLNKETKQNSPRVFRYSEKLIGSCAELGNPKECLMEFLAQIESLDEIKFVTLLKPVQTTILRLPEKKAPLVQCFLYEIHSFINNLALPQYQHFNQDSRLLLDYDEKVLKIRNIYSLLIDFYEPFVNELSGKCEDKRTKDLKLVLIQALFHMLGYPIVFLDLAYNEKGSSCFWAFSSKIIKFILKLQSNAMYFLTLVEDKQFISVDEEKTIIKEFASSEIRSSDLSLSVFFYLVLCENMCSFPCVYNRLFIYQNCLTLAVTLLSYKETMVLKKGLSLARATLDTVEPGEVGFPLLDSDVHRHLMKLLSNIVVYNDVEEDRKMAVDLIKKHLFTFEPKGQYYILLNCQNIADHPSLFGYFTSLLTIIVQDVFRKTNLHEYFTKKRLFDLLKIFCFLKKGAETDLRENKDQILSALNLVIFLTRRDRENLTGVWDHAECLVKNFLSPLRKAIDLSRAHYKLDLKALNDPVKSKTSGDKLNVSVQGQELARLSKEEKIGVLNAGLTVFDLVEHLLSRANECIQDNPI